MRAGFARVSITPPIGTRMMGFGTRDRERGCEAIHDPVFVRALYVEDGNEAALIAGFDLCFVGREESDRLKGAIGRRIDLLPRQILLNASHTHCGPSVGTWAYADYVGPDTLYLQQLEAAVVRAACAARENARPASLLAGETRSRVPLHRRGRDETGRMIMRPNPEGPVHDRLPVALLQASDGEPICLLFSISCHPSTISGFEISADYPGVAMELLDAHLGKPAALFLQGTGGDAKPRVVGDGPRWRVGDWEDVRRSGSILAGEVTECLAAGLKPQTPAIRTAALEMAWPLQSARSRDEYAALAGKIEGPVTQLPLKQLWAARQVERLDRGEELAKAVPVTLHGVQLAQGLRLVGMEGEAVGAFGHQIDRAYPEGITFALGYSNGQGLYLVTSAQLDEGGMEAESWYEYTWPAPLAKGMEAILERSLQQLRERGVA